MQLMAEWNWEEEEAALHHEMAHYLSLSRDMIISYTVVFTSAM